VTTDQRYYAFKIPDLTNQLKECSEIDQSDKILRAFRHILLSKRDWVTRWIKIFFICMDSYWPK